MKLLKLGSMAKKCVSVILATGMILSVLPQDMRKMTASEKNVSAAALRNPRIEEDSSLDAGQKVTWDCIYFGSYPQTEIVDKKENSVLMKEPGQKQEIMRLMQKPMPN